MTSAIAVIPEIELAGGKVAGADEPARLLAAWRFETADLFHVVDVDAQLGGPAARQKDALRSLVEAARRVPIQLSGGLVDLPSIEETFALGISRVVLPAALAAETALVSQLLQKYGVQRVAMELDEGSASRARAVVDTGVKLVAMHVHELESAALREVAGVAASAGAFVMAHVPLTSPEDALRLRGLGLANIVGLFVGRPLVERAFTVPQLRRALDGPLR